MDRIAELEREVAFLRSIIEAQGKTIEKLLDGLLRAGAPIGPAVPVQPPQPLPIPIYPGGPSNPYDPLNPHGSPWWWEVPFRSDCAVAGDGTCFPSGAYVMNGDAS